jgi:hypothetical protein
MISVLLGHLFDADIVNWSLEMIIGLDFHGSQRETSNVDQQWYIKN